MKGYIGLDGKQYAWNEEMEDPFAGVDVDELIDEDETELQRAILAGHEESETRVLKGKGHHTMKIKNALYRIELRVWNWLCSHSHDLLKHHWF
jgi:hypothetical protein